MRGFVDRTKLGEFMQRLGQRATTPGTVYLTGGATALLLGIREQTIDIDIKLDPEPEGAFEAIADLKDSLGVNVELAAPDQFIPPLPGWKERSELILIAGKVAFKHYDFYSQALAKIERGHEQDIADARSFLAKGLVNEPELKRLFKEIRPQLIRYPALDPADFEQALEHFLRAHDNEDSE